LKIEQVEFGKNCIEVIEQVEIATMNATEQLHWSNCVLMNSRGDAHSNNQRSSLQRDHVDGSVFLININAFFYPY